MCGIAVATRAWAQLEGLFGVLKSGRKYYVATRAWAQLEGDTGNAVRYCDAVATRAWARLEGMTADVTCSR